MWKSCHGVSGRNATRATDSPLELPVSIRELALLPRRPRLLLRSAVPPFPSLMALLRRMTGVSANGKAILVAPCLSAGDRGRFLELVLSSAVLRESLACTFLFCTLSGAGSSVIGDFSLSFVFGGGFDARASTSDEILLDLLTGCASFASGVEKDILFLRFGAESWSPPWSFELSCVISGMWGVFVSCALGFCFFTLVNVNPSSSSSYAICCISQIQGPNRVRHTFLPLFRVGDAILRPLHLYSG